jgi:hypothetical protein
VSEDDARSLGYEVVEASAIELGLVKTGRGIRTWWKSEFNGWPKLSHPKVQEAIRINEEITLVNE